MAPNPHPQQGCDEDLSPLQKRTLDRFFHILKTLVSRSTRQLGLSSQAADKRWILFLGLLLLLLNVGFFFNLEYWLEGILGWPVLVQDNFGLQLLLYFLLSFFLCFLIGVLRGRKTRQTGAVIRLSVRAEVIGVVPIIVLYELLGFLVAGVILTGLASRFRFLNDLIGNFLEGDFAALALIILGFSYVPILGSIQLFVGIGGIKLGSLLGSHFLRKRPDSAEAMER